ncbi:helix-turn-helix domain-containing protein [Methylomonas rapida]|uniref:Helix-turn-helix transcriptional regulator n=1 Tax=Methylomonas rapida TaxID=2963939 RepID=A0ABY7GPW1_9GAMM|nr:helix-turn-helix transcriptional regulator [Methylomonas rapida]WAR46544.1 helix-turn-helix transcriptional regulator [Methylomonas rapida]
MSVQFIEQNGQRQYAILPMAEYEALLDKVEMLEDIKAYDEAMRRDEEMIPAEVVYRLLNENKTKVWREYRGLTQSELAECCGLAQATIAQIEGGKRTGSIDVLKKIAAALTLDLDDLV